MLPLTDLDIDQTLAIISETTVNLLQPRLTMLLDVKALYAFLSQYPVIKAFIIINIIGLKHSKTILENHLKIKPQPAALDFEDFS